MIERRPLLGITMGDPAGIGPEILLRAVSHSGITEICRPLAVGDASLLSKVENTIVKENIKIVPLNSEDEVGEAGFEYGSLTVLDLGNVDVDRLVYGKVSPECGKAAFEYIKKTIELALAGTVDGTVTGPIHKQALRQAGMEYAGHTEIYADLTGTKEYAMMLVDDTFRVVHVSTHVSLREAVDRVKKERILSVIALADKTLKKLGIHSPRIAVAGLNPHASDGGLFGDEEEKEIAPAVAASRENGINAEGPIPPDTCFSKAAGGQYDIAVAMYHDQGHIPLKLHALQWDDGMNSWTRVRGINVTVGLPIVRTSVDHGVAFDQAGKGTASEESLVAAIEFAAQLAIGKSDRREG